VRKISAPLGAGSDLAELEIPESKKIKSAKNEFSPIFSIFGYKNFSLL
jgi:hypothetical protein